MEKQNRGNQRPCDAIGRYAGASKVRLFEVGTKKLRHYVFCFFDFALYMWTEILRCFNYISSGSSGQGLVPRILIILHLFADAALLDKGV